MGYTVAATLWFCAHDRHLSLCVPLLRIPHRSEIVQYLTWLISLSVMPSKFIHGVANDRIPFFLKAE